MKGARVLLLAASDADVCLPGWLIWGWSTSIAQDGARRLAYDIVSDSSGLWMGEHVKKLIPRTASWKCVACGSGNFPSRRVCNSCQAVPAAAVARGRIRTLQAFVEWSGLPLAGASAQKNQELMIRSGGCLGQATYITPPGVPGPAETPVGPLIAVRKFGEALKAADALTEVVATSGVPCAWLGTARLWPGNVREGLHDLDMADPSGSSTRVRSVSRPSPLWPRGKSPTPR